MLCPICEECEMKHFDNYCPICGWEHTPIAFIDADLKGGANPLTANEHKIRFNKIREQNPSYKWENDPKRHEGFRWNLTA